MKFHRDQLPRFALASLSLAMGGFCLDAQADVVYSSLPIITPSPTNVASLGYQATSTSEFGDHIVLAAGGRSLQNVTVTLSDWATASQYGGSGDGYLQNLTFNIYNYAGTAAAGSLIASKTINTLIPWRPESNPQQECGSGYRGADLSCHNGIAFDVTFDFASLGITLPDNLVFGLAFNTESYGASPTAVDGPYDSLNFGFSSGATVGTDVDPNAVFWNTSYQPFLTTGTAGVFGQDRDAGDNGWGGFVPAVQFVTADAVTVPEPSSIALLGIAGAGVLVARRRRAIR